MTLGIIKPPPMDVLELEPTSAMGEEELFRGYSSPTVSRACACGGRIRAHDLPEAIAAAVLVHNRSTAHAAWAIEHGWRRG
jgi:hypothetical protein